MKYMTSILVLVIMVIFQAGVATGKAIKIRRGSAVTYHYTVSIDGEAVDASQRGEPVQYIHGKKILLPKLEKQLKGMKVGDQKTFTLKAADAYGLIDPDAVIEFSREQMPGDIDFKKGMVLEVKIPGGIGLPGVVMELKETSVFVNFNHPLAGKDLTFDISIVEVK